MIRRLIGIVMILVGVSGMVLSGLGAWYGPELIDSMGANFEETLRLASESLDTVQESMLLAQATMTDVSASLDTMETAAENVSTTLAQSQPFLAQSNRILSQELPESIETLQATIPDVAQAAEVVDQTLTALNRVRIDETVPIINYRIQWDLGVDYAPSQPFDESVYAIGDSLEGLPQDFRALDDSLRLANENVGTISEDMTVLATDLARINGRLEELEPVFEEYIVTITGINDAIRQTRGVISEQLETARLVLTIAMIWLGFAQIVPFYFGYELLTGRRTSLQD